MDLNKVIEGDCVEKMSEYDDESFDLIFADPPFNIGYEYDVYKDTLPYKDYCEWSRKWIEQSYRVLKSKGSIYVAIGDEFAAEINMILKNQGFYFRNWIIWEYGFGENQRKKFNRCHTHIHYFVKDKKNFTFNAKDILIPSQRQLKYKDKRAKHGGKLPNDVWNVSRVCGTFKERLKLPNGKSFPCQMPEEILKRIIKVSSNENDIIFDPFCGSGVTAYCAKQLGRNFLTTDLSSDYCKLAAKRIFNDENEFVKS